MKTITISDGYGYILDDDCDPTYTFECDESVMSPEEFRAAMETIKNDPAENSYEETKHRAADHLCLTVLQSLGYAEGVDVFHSIHKWYD